MIIPLLGHADSIFETLLSGVTVYKFNTTGTRWEDTGTPVSTIIYRNISQTDSNYSYQSEPYQIIPLEGGVFRKYVVGYVRETYINCKLKLIYNDTIEVLLNGVSIYTYYGTTNNTQAEIILASLQSGTRIDIMHENTVELSDLKVYLVKEDTSETGILPLLYTFRSGTPYTPAVKIA